MKKTPEQRRVTLTKILCFQFLDALAHFQGSRFYSADKSFRDMIGTASKLLALEGIQGPLPLSQKIQKAAAALKQEYPDSPYDNRALSDFRLIILQKKITDAYIEALAPSNTATEAWPLMHHAAHEYLITLGIDKESITPDMKRGVIASVLKIDPAVLGKSNNHTFSRATP